MRYTRLTSLHPFGVIVVLLLAPLGAYANDSSFGGVGADLTPQKRNDIVMVSEEIKAVEREIRDGQRVWSLDAEYTFKNPTAHPISFVMGFPERLCHPDRDCASPSSDHTTFRDIITEVNGRRVRSWTQATSQATQWGEELGRVHLFNVSFKPRETLKIKHRYLMGISTSVEGELRFDYITKTGALWGAPIGRATFSVSVKQRPIGFYYPKEYMLRDYRVEEHESSLMSTVVFEQERWTPRSDLKLTFTYEMTRVFQCPSTQGLSLTSSRYPKRVAELLRAPELRLKPRDHEGEIARDFIKASQALSLDQLKVCRNVPFARYGYRFKTQQLSRTLYQYAQPTSLHKMYDDYTSGTFTYDEAWFKSMKGVLFRPSQRYHQRMLTRVEWTYIKAIKQIEKHRERR